MKRQFLRFKNLKVILKKIMLFCSFIACLFLLIINIYNKTLFDNIKLKTLDIFAPLISFLATPINYIDEMGSHISAYFFLASKNAILQQENANLLQWREKALALEADNIELKKILNVQQSNMGTFYTAPILRDDNSPFSQSIVLGAGAEQGVKRGDILFTTAGIYGRVIEVANSVARALKLTDYYSRLPVMVGKNKINAIMMGNNTPNPILTAYPYDADFKVGDMVLSSCDMGVYPANLAIGKVSYIDKSMVKITLFAHIAPKGFVKVKSYNLPGLLESK